MPGMEGFTEADVRETLLRAIRLLALLTAVAALLVLWKMGWRSAVLLMVGTAISGSGLWEWMRLMSTVMARMDGGREGRPMGLVLTGFFLRLGLAVVMLYVSLRYIHGSVAALAIGLGLGIFTLTVEAVKMARTWTV